MNAQIVSNYRVVLKQLARAVRTKPHYVQDIRFLLSRPLVCSSIATEAEQQQANYNCQAVRPQQQQPCLTDKTASTAFDGSVVTPPRQPSASRASASAALCEPPPPWTADARALFRVCQTDLRQSLDAAHTTRMSVAPPDPTIASSSSSPSLSISAMAAASSTRPLPGTAADLLAPSSFSPVALQMLRCRELLWLRHRLDTVLHHVTTQRLAHVLNVAAGPTEVDFIPDHYFDKEEGGGHATGSTTERTAHEESVWAELDDEDDDAANLSPSSCVVGASSTSRDSAPARMRPVHSAGAIGAQREMYVLRHVGSFPLARHFLKGVGGLSEQQLELCTHSHECLQKLVRQCVSREFICRDNQVQLSVQACAFDARFQRNRRTAALGYFATSHRQFMLKFRIDPVNCSDPDVQIQMINSYFTRLDVKTGELIEEVGYLHSYDVRCMLQERDLPIHVPTPPAADEAVGDDDDARARNGRPDAVDGSRVSKKCPEDDQGDTKDGVTATSSLPSGKEDTGTDAEAPVTTGRGRHFDLFFLNPSDGPCVLRGVFFYKRGCSLTIRDEAIHVISFGPVLLSSE